MIIKDGYIIAVSPADENYSAVKNAIANCPVATDGHIYRLREDLVWELCELPEAVESDELITAEDEIETYKAALTELGVETEDDNAE